MTGTAELGKLKNYVKMKKLASKLSPTGHEAALVTSETNIRYLTDFANSEGTLFVARDKAYLLVDGRYTEAARKNVTNAEIIEYSKYYETITELVRKYSMRDLIIESSSMTVDKLRRLEAALSGTGCRVMTNDRLDRLIMTQRIIKSKEEIAKMRKAQQITEEAFTELLSMVRPGVKESQLALELEFLMRRKGAQGVSFDLITITGAKTSMPHGVPGDVEVKRGDFVTFDIGAIYDGYHSDMTRTVAVGEVSDKQREVYNVVLQAQTTALSRVKSGVKAYEIDMTARSIIARAGYGDYFKHATGHGVGLEIHEQPSVSSRGETLLSEGMIITVEPGIYLPGEFGVRIEDMVAVTKDGYDNFATLPKELMILDV
ncbi:MAG: aminopeptidase P family protein [Clostridia bacterium]|nr:aminopeptidase P family protein [Clostridia bacterium]